MAGVDELHFDAVDERHRTVEAERLQLRQRTKGVRLAVERQRGAVLGVMQTIGLARVFFLQPRRVRQHKLAEIGGAGRAEDPAVITLCDEPRKVAGMIEVRVGQNHGGEVGCRERQRLPVAESQLLQTLKQSAVDENPLSVDIDQVLGAGYRSGRPQECELCHNLAPPW